VDIKNLLLALLVEGEDLVTGWRVRCLLEVRVQASPCASAPLRDGILLVDVLGLLTGLVLLVELLQSRCEARGEAVLVVEGECSLDCFVANSIAMSKVLSQNASAGLVLLVDLGRARSA